MNKANNVVMSSFWFLVCAGLFAEQAWAFSSGVTGRSGQTGTTCNACHGGSSYNSSVSISGDTEVAPGSNNDYTVILTHTAAFAGFNLSTEDGSLVANDSGTRISSSELVHSSSRAASGGQTSWSFQWTAPSSAGSNTFWVCGNPVDGNGSTSGDESSTPCTTMSVTVASNSAPTASNDSTSVNEDASVEISILANDSDSDGSLNTSSVSIVSPVSNGTTSVNSSGVVTYTPSDNFNGADSFTYTVNDNEGATSNTATVSITINSVNDTPTASNDSATTNEDNAVTISVLNNDSDVDDTLSGSSITITAAPSNGSTSINTSAGTVTYTPTGNFNGADSFSYTVQDDEGATSNTAQVSITVNSVNDAPVANNDSATTDEDSAVTVSVLSNDTDVDDTINSSTLAVSQSPSNGSAAVSGSSIIYTPNSNFNGSDSFQYTVADTSGSTSNTATVTITVNDINDAPTASSDSSTTAEDTPVTISILSNDSDIDGSLVNSSIAIVSNVSNGTTNVNTSDGTVTYTPSGGFNGSDSFSYSVNDDDGATSNTATVSITVTEVNDAPVAANDSATTDEDNSVEINVVSNDSDSDGTIDADTVTIVSSPSNGSTSIASGIVTYSPNTNFNGADSFTYTVNDDKGGTSNTATVSINVNSINDLPVASNDSVAIEVNEPTSIEILANDSDVDGTIDSETVAIISDASNGTTNVDTTNGKVSYTPNTDFSGDDSFSYQVKDNDGGTSNTATVSITVRLNQAPVATDDSMSTDEDNAVTISVLSNDSDDLSIDTSSVAIVDAASSGTASANNDGTVTYTPNSNFNGADSFTYTVKDNQGATSNTASVSITVNAVNDTPTFTSSPVTSVTQNNNYTYTITTTDIEDDSISLTLTTDQTWLSLSDNLLSGIPPLDAIGNHEIMLTASDGTGSTNQAFTLTVNPRTDADLSLVASISPSPSVAGNEVTLTISVTNSGPADANGAMVSIALQGAVEVINSGPNCEGSSQLSCTLDTLENGANTTLEVSLMASEATDVFVTTSVSFSEDLNNDNNMTTTSSSIAGSLTTAFNDTQGENSRSVVIGDITGDGLADAIYINGNSANDHVYINNGSGQMTFASSLQDGMDGAAGALFDLDGDNDLDLIVANCSGHANQVYFNENSNFTLGHSLGDKDSRAVAVADVNGDDVVELIFANADGANTIYMKGEDGNYSLVASLQSASGHSHSLGIVAADFNGDAFIDIAVANGDGANKIYFNTTGDTTELGFDTPIELGSANSMGVALLDANSDNTMDLVFANSGASSDIMAPANRLYLNQGDKSFSEGTAIGLVNSRSVKAADIDGDNQLDLMFINSHGGHQIYGGDGSANFALRAQSYYNPHAISASIGDVDNDGDLDILFADTQNKTDNVLLNDGSGSLIPPTVDLETFINSPSLVNSGASFDISFSATSNTNDLVSNGSMLSIQLPEQFEMTSTTPDNCTITGNDIVCEISQLRAGVTSTINITGIATLSSGQLSFGSNITSSTNEANEANNSASMSVTVNGKPVANNDSGVTQSGSSITILVLENDTDESPLSEVSIATNAANGTTQANNDGTISYTANAEFVGDDSFTYIVTDEHGLQSDAATVSISVKALPVANDDSASVQSGNSVTINVLGNDTGEAPFTLTINEAPANGSASVSADGSIRYTANSAFTGSDTFTYTFTDSFGSTSNAGTVSVNVTAAPVTSSGGGGGGSINLLVLLGVLMIAWSRRLPAHRRH